MRYNLVAKFFVVIALNMLFILNAYASITVLDTGQPEYGAGGLCVFNEQSVAVRFYTSDSIILDNIFFWMSGLSDRTATMIIYKNDGIYTDRNVPGTEIFSEEFSLASSGDNPFYYEGWSGLSNSGFLLNSGYYWAAVEVRGSQTLDGGVGEFGPPYDGSLNPMPSTEFAVKTNNGFPQFDNIWRNCENCNMAFGARITAQPVPLPASIYMFGLSMIVIGAVSWLGQNTSCTSSARAACPSWKA